MIHQFKVKLQKELKKKREKERIITFLMRECERE